MSKRLPIIIILVILVGGGFFLFSRGGASKALDRLADLEPMFKITYESAESSFFSSSIVLNNVEIERMAPDGEEPFLYSIQRLEIQGANAGLLDGGEQLMADSLIAEGVNYDGYITFESVRIDGLRNDWAALKALLIANDEGSDENATGAAVALQQLMGRSDKIVATGVAIGDFDYYDEPDCAVGKITITGNNQAGTAAVVVENLEVEGSTFAKLELSNITTRDLETLSNWVAEEEEYYGADYYDVFLHGLEPVAVESLLVDGAELDADNMDFFIYFLPTEELADMFKNIQFKNLEIVAERGTITATVGNLELQEIGDWSIKKFLVENLAVSGMGMVNVSAERMVMNDFDMPPATREIFERLMDGGIYGYYYGYYDDEDNYPDYEDERFWTEDGEFDADAYEQALLATEDGPFAELLAPLYSLIEIKNVKAEFLGQYVYLDSMVATIEDKAEYTSTSKMTGLRISAGVLNLMEPGMAKAMGFKEFFISHDMVARTTDQRTRLVFEGSAIEVKDGGVLTMSGEIANEDGESLGTANGARNALLKDITLVYNDKSLMGRIFRAIAVSERERPQDMLAELLEDLEWEMEYVENDLEMEALTALRTFIEKPGTFTVKMTPQEPLTMGELQEILEDSYYFDPFEDNVLGLSFEAVAGSKSILDKP